MYDLETFLDALGEYQQATVALRDCQEKAGYEAGYFCSREFAAVERAKTKAGAALAQLIDEQLQIAKAKGAD